MGSLAERLYEDDFHAWAMDQADALRRLAETRPNVGLDFPHLIEEVEDLARAERNAARSQVRRIIEHCLKLEHAMAGDPRAGWYDSIADARAEIEDKLTPTIRRDLEEQLRHLYARARDKTEGALRRHGEAEAAAALPADCPYQLDEILEHGWHPASRRGFADGA